MQHTGLYPIVSKGMRLAAQGKDPLDGQKHTCGMGNLFHYHSTGFPELDEIMRTPQPLIFIMELISVGQVDSHSARKQANTCTHPCTTTCSYTHSSSTPPPPTDFSLQPKQSVTECYTIKCYTPGKKCCSQFSDHVFNPQPSETSMLQFFVYLRWATRSLTSGSLGWWRRMRS